MSSQDENDNVLSPSNNDQPISFVSHKRRVHFPTDESQLRMISIAPEPLSDQPLFSLGVILQRYRGACQRLQIRPLNTLLEQLNTMEDGRKSFHDRLDSLEIRNEKLDIKHIDAIEEILSRCRFHTLDFDSAFPDDLTLVQIFDVIEYYESCTYLNLSNNRAIGLQGYQALTRYLRKTRYLERLDMNSIRFDDTSMLGFGRSLRMSSTLYELHLESCQLNGKILQKFIQNLRSCSCLRELYLCDNRLQVQDSLLINELIRSCGQFLHLLDLRSNALQDNGMSHIASQLSQYDEHHTQQNAIYKISLQSNQLTAQGVAFLAKSLLHNRTIRSLNLSHNNITNEGLYLLRDALLTNRTVTELILRNCRLTDQAAISLAEFVAESSAIQYIDLRENNIQASGICGMAIAIKSNRSLLKLDFDPIISTIINSNSKSNKNNKDIDRTTVATNTTSLLSFSNLRRMTVGLGSFTSSSSLNSIAGNGETTREIIEQTEKWIGDIARICQRNLLIYEEQLREQEEQQNGQTMENNNEKEIINEIDHKETTIVTPNDVVLEEQMTDTIVSEPSVTVDNEQSIVSTQKNSEEVLVSTENISQSIDTPVDHDNPTDTKDETEQPRSAAVNNENESEQLLSTSVKQDNEVHQSASDNKVEQLLDTHTNNNDEVGQPITTPTNGTHEGEQPTIKFMQSMKNGGSNPEVLQTNITDENSLLPDSSSLSDLTEDNLNDDDDDKRKIRHSDSLYLLRKKVQNEDDDDDTQLSSSTEHQEIVAGV